MNTITDQQIITAMKRYGGSFVEALAQAAAEADADNLTRIKTTWPEYWWHYSAMARAIEEENESKSN